MTLDRYAVFGNPIAQSKSPEIHSRFALQTAQNILYEKYCVDLESFAKTASVFFAEGGKGLNITAPFKNDAFNFADTVSETAKIAEAVNTLTQQEDGSIHGDTTDGVGLVTDILHRLRWQICNKTLLVLGAGGAVRGVLWQLLNQSPLFIRIANRTQSKADALASTFSHLGDIDSVSFDEDPGRPYDLIINGTSAGLSGGFPPLNPKTIGRNTCVYDMVYGREPTSFMTWSEEMGAKSSSDGLGMLVGQAAESFRIWRGKEVETESVFKFLQEQL